MRKIYTSYGDIGNMGMYVARPNVGFYGYGLTTGDPIVIGADTYYVYRDYGDKVSIWLGVFETTGDASAFLAYAKGWLRDRVYTIVDDIAFTKIVPSGNYPGMYEAFLSVAKPLEEAAPAAPFRPDRPGLVAPELAPPEEEKKTNWVPWAIGGAVVGGIVLTGIIVAATSKKRKYRR